MSLLVKVDSELADLIPEYFEDLSELPSTINAYLKDGRFSEIKSIGHQMKGHGSAYGFHFIAEIGRSIESLSESKNEDAIKIEIENLQKKLDSVEIEYY